jgi:hypothetical protein
LFRHSRDQDPAASSDGATPAAPDLGASVQHFRELTVPQRAAEVLAGIEPPGVRGRRMADVLSRWVPDLEDPPDDWFELQRLLLEAFQALELSRLVMRYEPFSNKWETDNRYVISPDGLTALERGDVAEVVTRRLPA